MAAFAVQNSRKAFTIVELLVAIVVFALGLVAAYSLLQTATSVSARSRDEIVGGNLLREQVELIKNVRDSNWVAFRRWDSLLSGVAVKSDDPSFCPAVSPTADNCRLSPGYYVVENDFADPATPIRIRKLSSIADRAAVFAEANASDTKLRLCVDPLGRYTHDCFPGREKTPFYSYVKVDTVTASDSAGNPVTVSGALSVTAHFASTDSGYRELQMATIITDWKR
jgi:prepilin-type N-terminal cleavage/methylation domain-containing protein